MQNTANLGAACRPDDIARLERVLLENIVPFWLDRAIDIEHGGYLIGHDPYGRPRPGITKGLVTQARLLWLFARLYRSGYGRPEHLRAADCGYRFLRDHFRDAEYGGFHWQVDVTGERKLQSGKHLYGQSFALFALAEYGQASGDDEAMNLARSCFESIEAKGHDSVHGGYVEDLDRDWQPGRPGVSTVLGTAAGIKTMNTHMHLLESLTAWHRAMPSPLARQRIAELTGILSGLSAGAGGDEYSADWSPRQPVPARVSYGHHLENIWLMIDACEASGLSPYPLLPRLRDRFARCLEYGYDHRLGGFFEYGPPQGQAVGRDKIWWVQAEALPACLHLYRLTGSPIYPAIFRRTLAFIERRQVDWRHGEWHARVTPRGPAREDKAHLWKTGYHNGRAMLESLVALKALPSA